MKTSKDAFKLTAKRVSREQELYSTCKPFVEPHFTFSLVGWRGGGVVPTSIDCLWLSVKGYKFWPILGTHGQANEQPTRLNGHHRGPVTLTTVTERLAVERSRPFWRQDCPDRRLNPDLPHARGKLYHYATTAVVWVYMYM